MRTMYKLAAVAVLAVTGQSTAAAQVQFYNGDFNGVDGVYSSQGGTTEGMVFDNFTVGGSGLFVTGLFGQFMAFSTTSWTSAAWEVRSGISEGDGGTLLFSGVDAATQDALGAGISGLDLYGMTVGGLGGFFLAPGEYWFGLAASGVDGVYLATASGTNGVNANIDGAHFFHGPDFGYTYTGTLFSYDFSIGVEGRLTESTVPEPATMTLLATGLAGLAGARRRRRTNA